MKELEMKWVPVKERLPEKDGLYLITEKTTDAFGVDYYSVETAEFTDSIESKYDEDMYEVDPEIIGKGPKFFDWTESINEWGELNGYSYPYTIDDVIAWMPLPEAYEED